MSKPVPPWMRDELIPTRVDVAALFWSFQYILINAIEKNLLIFLSWFLMNYHTRSLWLLKNLCWRVQEGFESIFF